MAARASTLPRMKRYGQYCPIAKAAEILTERWTLLVLRELTMGTTRYNDIRRGVPLMSPSVLAQRLKTLELAGIVERYPGSNKRSHEYKLTPAGAELQPIIHAVGVWGQRWVRSRMDREDLDASFLMWDIRRNVKSSQFPARRIVIYFEFMDAKKGMRRWWLVVENGEVDLCLEDPSHDIDLVVTSDLRCLTQVWMGDIDLATAISTRKVKVEGDARLRKTIVQWLGPSPFGMIKSAIGTVGDARTAQQAQNRA